MLEIIKPAIFPENIKAGITKANKALFPPYGFSIFPGEIYSLEKTEEFRQILSDELKIDRTNLKLQKQVHEDDIIMIGKGSTYKEPLPFADGMITSQKGVALIAAVADCAAVLAYDTDNQVIGAFHSGWKGTKLNIAAKGIRMMVNHFNTKTKDVLVYVSPCAGGKSYEVGEEVAKHFPESTIIIKDGKYLLDIRKEIKKQLLELEIPESNIEISEECSILNEELHSFRRDKEKSGRMAAFIVMI